MSRLAPVEAPTGDTPLGLLGGAVGPSRNCRKRILFWNGWSIPPGVKHAWGGLEIVFNLSISIFPIVRSSILSGWRP